MSSKPSLAKENSVSGLNAIVTGGSRGIGKAISVALANQGCNLALIARNPDTLEAAAKECAAAGSPSVVTIPCDITDKEGLDSAFKEIIASFGTIHILVNNAGTGATGPALQAPLESWERVISTNLSAAMHLTKLVLPFMKDRNEGTIVNIASLASKFSLAGGTDYCTSKHGLLGFSRALFEDVRELNIKVSSINPGFVETDMVSQVQKNHSKFIRPEDVAHAVLFVCKFPTSACPLEIDLYPQLNPDL